eukprot:7558053-Pyramimonas_sp.AAC.1
MRHRAHLRHGHWAQEAPAPAGIDSGADTDAISSLGEEEQAASDPELRGTPAEQRGALILGP